MLRIHPDHAIAHNNVGKALRAQGRTDRAYYHFLRAIELGLDQTQTRYDIANLLRQSDRNPEAAQHYRRVLEIDPTHVGAKRAFESMYEEAP